MSYVQMPGKNRHAPAGMERCKECGGLVRAGEACPRCERTAATRERMRVEGRPVKVTRADGTVAMVEDHPRVQTDAPAFTYSKGNVKLCKGCGRPFSSNGRLYCSERCKPRAERQVAATCKTCGRSFVAKSCRERYCSEDCRRLAANKAARERQRRMKKPLGDGVCPVCGATFAKKREGNVYCSPRCGNKAAKARARERAAKVAGHGSD